MRPLSIIHFIRGSAAKILPMALTVCLAVAILYFMGAFVDQLNTHIQETVLYPLQNMSIITGNNSGIRQEDAEILNAEFSSRYFYAQCMDVAVYNAVGSSTTMFVMTQQNQLATLMDIQGARLVKGRMPEQPLEIIMSTKLAINHGFEVGSIVEKGQKGWRNDTEMIVVGLFDSAGIFGMGIAEEDKLRLDTPFISAVVMARNDKMAETNLFIEENFAGNYNIFTIGMIENFLRNFNGPMNAMKSFVTVVLIVVMGVFLTNITMIQYTVRKKELELLHAIGYTRKYIIKKALSEIGVAAIIGYLCGIALAVAICWLINVFAWDERGLSLALFSFNNAVTMLLVPVFITLFSMVAPWKMTKFRDIA